MQFASPLVPGRLIKRYARFLADIERPDGSMMTAHTANTGSMLGCSAPGSRVWLSRSPNPKRKYPFTWEIVETQEGVLVGINTLFANRLVEESIQDGTVSELQGYQRLRREVKYGQEKSRIDLLLEADNTRPSCYVEVKNVTAVLNQGMAVFPDAVSKRGTKHLRELQTMVEKGYRALVFFCIQRGDVEAFQAAAHIDPQYAETLANVVNNGVEVLAYDACVAVTGIHLNRVRPVILV